ncbi:hypothetical protein AOLI_G00277710 [Acnodon oligacanthus]
MTSHLQWSIVCLKRLIKTNGFLFQVPSSKAKRKKPPPPRWILRGDINLLTTRTRRTSRRKTRWVLCHLEGMPTRRIHGRTVWAQPLRNPAIPSPLPPESALMTRRRKRASSALPLPSKMLRNPRPSTSPAPTPTTSSVVTTSSPAPTANNLLSNHFITSAYSNNHLDLHFINNIFNHGC